MRYTIKNIANWYYLVGDSATEVFSTQRGIFVSLTDATYNSWLAAGNVTGVTPSNQDLLNFILSYNATNSSANINPYNLMSLQQAQQYKIQSLVIQRNTIVQQRLKVSPIYGTAANATAGTPNGTIIDLPYDDVLATTYNALIQKASSVGYVNNFQLNDTVFGVLNMSFSTTDWTNFSNALTVLNNNAITQNGILNTAIDQVNVATTVAAVQAVVY